ncbi:GntT/GntP/DsdX family permease [Tuberibacillus sp. Marseille-P3662]|uniref:GntT/GntP/DsdX family permease n=1 Tax=Tuberibacillus sp. Marseille-P3662 TaxID=1965358 RepID=UPI000A1C7D11|nr:gluconate:H+ symporter [Tuberibacillus sp. Marseille-P3662]
MPDWYLILATVAAIVVVIIGVTVLNIHPFISLLIASVFLGLAADVPIEKLVGHFEQGVGDTLSSLTIIIGLGTVLGGMLAESGGGLQIANTLTKKLGVNKIHWAMMISGFIIGLPVFFEVGVVLLIPLVVAVSKSTKKSIILVGMPLIAGLSIVHGIIPPHPGAMTGIKIYNADVGSVLIYGLIVAIPSVIIAGPLFGKWISKRVTPSSSPKVGESSIYDSDENGLKEEDIKNGSLGANAAYLPTPGWSFFTVLLPIILILLSTFGPYLNLGEGFVTFVQFIGDPVIALLISVLVAFFTLKFNKKWNKGKFQAVAEHSLKPMAAIIFIIGAGGGFSGVLSAAGIGDVIGNISAALSVPPLVLAFVIAALVRVATGSATVSLITAAGIVAPAVAGMADVNTALLVIATGAGSLIFSHVNDGGFWLIKEYMGLSVKETFQTWTVLETLLSLTAFVCVLILNIFV